MKLKKMFILTLNLLVLTNTFATDKLASMSYDKRIKNIIYNIDLLPDLFYAYLDQPTYVTVYDDYNKTSNIGTVNEESNIILKYNFNNDLLTDIKVFDTKINPRGEQKTYEKQYLLNYDNENRISKIESIKAPKVVFSFVYTKNKITVNYAWKGKDTSVIYNFDLLKNKMTRKTNSKTVELTIIPITPNLEIKEIIETPMAQSLYNERIIKYDEQGRLLLFLDIHYDSPQSDVLIKDPWGDILTISYK